MGYDIDSCGCRWRTNDPNNPERVYACEEHKELDELRKKCRIVDGWCKNCGTFVGGEGVET